MITLICGGMWAGKTSELFRRLKRAQCAGQETRLYKYQGDTRYGREHMASSHDQVHVGAIPVTELLEDWIVPDTVIGIDEGQFIGNLVAFCEAAASQGCQVIVAALDSDYRRRGFPQILDLFPLCEEVVKLRAICFSCKKEAGFTHRLKESEHSEAASRPRNAQENPQENSSQPAAAPLVGGESPKIGGENMYQAVCRKCFRAANLE